jgi:hypothetical protein
MRGLWRLIEITGREWYEERAQRLGPPVAFYTAFALAPGLVVLTPLTAVPVGAEARTSTAPQGRDVAGHTHVPGVSPYDNPSASSFRLHSGPIVGPCLHVPRLRATEN